MDGLLLEFLGFSGLSGLGAKPTGEVIAPAALALSDLQNLPAEADFAVMLENLRAVPVAIEEALTSSNLSEPAESIQSRLCEVLGHSKLTPKTFPDTGFNGDTQPDHLQGPYSPESCVDTLGLEEGTITYVLFPHAPIVQSSDRFMEGAVYLDDSRLSGIYRIDLDFVGRPSFESSTDGMPESEMVSVWQLTPDKALSDQSGDQKKPPRQPHLILPPEIVSLVQTLHTEWKESDPKVVTDDTSKDSQAPKRATKTPELYLLVGEVAASLKNMKGEIEFIDTSVGSREVKGAPPKTAEPYASCSQAGQTPTTIPNEEQGDQSGKRTNPELEPRPASAAKGHRTDSPVEQPPPKVDLADQPEMATNDPPPRLTKPLPKAAPVREFSAPTSVMPVEGNSVATEKRVVNPPAPWVGFQTTVLVKEEPMVLSAQTSVPSIHPDQSVVLIDPPEGVKATPDSRVLDQIIRAVHIQRNSGHAEIRVRLVPENLGEVHLKVTMTGDGVVAEIRANSGIAHEVLSKNVYQLQGAFADSGVRVDQVIVKVGGTEPDHKWNGSHRDWSQQRRDPGDQPPSHGRNSDGFWGRDRSPFAHIKNKVWERYA